MMDMTGAFRSLFSVNMGLRVGERVVVFSDTVREDEQVSVADRSRRQRLFAAAENAGRFAVAEYGNARFVQFPATSGSGAEPPETLWRAVFGDAIVNALASTGLLARLIAKEALPGDLDAAREIVVAGRDAVADVVVALANNSTSHTRFRALANAAGTRYASLPHFDTEMFFTSMQVDWTSLAVRTRLLAEAVNRAEEIHITTPNGTSMRLGKRGRVAKGDDGLLTAPGSFGNLPAGEVYLAPVEGTARGVMVLEYAPTRKLVSPLTLVVEGGEVAAIKGDEPYREVLERKFAESGLNRNIAELGIGTNDRASRPDNILEAEKILGTIHIALGDNAGFGGRVSTPFHEDYVFYKPTVTAVEADGSNVILIADGALLIP